jgi:amicyanin
VKQSSGRSIPSLTLYFRRPNVFDGVMKLACLIILAAVLVSFTGIAVADNAQVNIKDFQYQPSTVTISRGDTVTWTNMDNVLHDVDFKGPGSPELKKGETYSKTFNDAGSFDYLCSIHPGMKGRVIVK